MGVVSKDAVRDLQALMEQVDEPLKRTFENVHQGYITETLLRFLTARDFNVAKAHKMLMDCLNWRIQNDIDNILGKPIMPTELYQGVRDSQLLGLSGYTKEGCPVVAIGVGQSTFDKASVHNYVQSHIQFNEYRDRVVLPNISKMHGKYIGTCVKILDMTDLKLSALSLIKLLTVISTIDDLNYPEKTDIYFIVNVPYIFSACWTVVKPLLQERTRKKVQVLQGCGKDELLKIMDYMSLPHFCKKENSGRYSYWSRNGSFKGNRSSEATNIDNCFSLDHVFHQDLYNFVKSQSGDSSPMSHMKQGSFHVDFPEPGTDESMIAKTIEFEFQKLGKQMA